MRRASSGCQRKKGLWRRWCDAENGKGAGQQLRILLIKSNYKKDKDIVKDQGRLNTFQLDSSLPFKGTLYVRAQYTKKPPWLNFVQPHIGGTANKLRKFGQLQNASTAAVLLIESANRTFAFTFGYGRNLLNPESWERDFGLKVVLNRVDPNSLRSVDCRTFEELTLQTRRQTSRGSSLDTFGLNVTQDILQQVAGTPSGSHKGFALRIAGSDGLLVALPIKFEQIGSKCKELLKAYNDKEYKKCFEFIDKMRREQDPGTRKALNQLLIKQLINGDTDRMHLAPPEPIDWQDLDGFTYTNRKDAEVHADLDIDEYLEYLRTREDKDITVEFLKQSRIGVRYGGAIHSDNRWSVYNCVVFETDYEGQFYVLTCGNWYEVEKEFVSRVNKRVRGLVNRKLSLPDAKSDEKEGDYNKRVGEDRSFIIVDRKCLRVDGSSIEPCDLFTPSNQFIHVKRKTRSATLSHLFAQGTVSANCFMGDIEFRKAFRDIVAEQDANQAKHIKDDRPIPSNYEVVYAIITKATKNWPISLPFFSKLNLMNAADHLSRTLGFNVALVRINVN